MYLPFYSSWGCQVSLFGQKIPWQKDYPNLSWFCRVCRWFITGAIWDLKVPKWAFFHPESAWSHKTSLETQCKLIGRPKPYPNRWKVKITRNGFSLIYGKSTLRIFYMLFMDLWGITHQKILVGNPGRKSLLAPGVQAPKTTFLPILGVKNSENQKFFFLQISIFLGQLMVLMTFFDQAYHFGSIANLSFWP